MIIKNGNVFCDDNVFRKTDIEVQDGKITAIGDNLSNRDSDQIDAENCYVIPGLVDIHIHGAMGADFSDANPDTMQDIARFLLTRGITSYLATTMTLAEEQITNACKTARLFVGKDQADQAVMRGIHLEGPFFSYERRGAQNADYLAKPDFDMLMRFYEASGETVKLVAVAPEVEGGLDFIKKAASICTVSIGHSDASYDIAHRAYSLGADHTTHMFNGMCPYNNREPGIVGAAFDSGAYVELITDGIHIHPSVVRAVFKLFSDDRICFISDAMRACGMPDGRYDLGGQWVTVEGKTASFSPGVLGGSVTTLDDCLRFAVEFGVPIEKAVKAATINPAESVGIDNEVGSLTVGKRADMLVLGKDLLLKNIIFGGKPVK